MRTLADAQRDPAAQPEGPAGLALDRAARRRAARRRAARRRHGRPERPPWWDRDRDEHPAKAPPSEQLRLW